MKTKSAVHGARAAAGQGEAAINSARAAYYSAEAAADSAWAAKTAANSRRYAMRVSSMQS